MPCIGASRTVPGMSVDAWPDGIEVRGIGKADAGAWADLLQAAEAVDDTGEHYDAEDLAEELDDPELNAETDTVALWAGDRMVGYASVRSNPNRTEKDVVRAEGTVRPDRRRRGLGTRLLDWTVARAGALHAERLPDLTCELHCGVADGNEGQRALLEKAGFEPVRYFFEMRVRLDGRPDAADVVPEGLRMIPFETAYDDATRDAHNEAFLDHWGSSLRDAEQWATWFTGTRAFRASYSRLLLDGDRVVAYVLGYEYPADTAATGIRDLYFGQVGTRRAYRGRGAANALLTSALTAAAADGFETASLGVDAANPTGALGLYERLGFTVNRRQASYSLPLG